MSHSEPRFRGVHFIENADSEDIASVQISQHANGVYWITQVWTKEEHRNQGLASLLLTAAVETWGAHDLYLMVSPFADQPMNFDQLNTFYEAFGFMPTSVPGILYRKLS
jgi:GNAT superfamily N-acetyltransferase